MGKSYLTATMEKGFDPKEIIGSEISVNGEKSGIIIEYNPESGDMKIEIDTDVYDAVMQKMGRPISASSTSPFKKLKEEIAELTDEQRLEIFSEYCKYCGCNDPGCQCWNDD